MKAVIIMHPYTPRAYMLTAAWDVQLPRGASKSASGSVHICTVSRLAQTSARSEQESNEEQEISKFHRLEVPKWVLHAHTQ